MRLPLKRWPLLLLALVAYYLPWVYHRAAALTFNANDLAEWTSLAPAVRGASIPLMVPFLLRVVLALLALIYGLQAGACADRSFGRWAYALLAIVLAITLLPPAEFFRGAWDDVNYRQQFGIALGTIIGLVAIAIAQRRSWLQPYQRVLGIMFSMLGIICAIVGEITALSVVRSYQIDATVGGGVVVLVICLGLSLFLPASAIQLGETLGD